MKRKRRVDDNNQIAIQSWLSTNAYDYVIYFIESDYKCNRIPVYAFILLNPTVLIKPVVLLKPAVVLTYLHVMRKRLNIFY